MYFAVKALGKIQKQPQGPRFVNAGTRNKNLSERAGLLRACGEGGTIELQLLPYGARKAHLAHNKTHKSGFCYFIIYLVDP